MYHLPPLFSLSLARFQGGIDSNDAEHPADKVVENVGDACTYMLGRETLPNAWTEEVECASS